MRVIYRPEVGAGDDAKIALGIGVTDDECAHERADGEGRCTDCGKQVLLILRDGQEVEVPPEFEEAARAHRQLEVTAAKRQVD